MGGYSEVFMGYDQANVLFLGWILLEQFVRILILTFASGIATTILLVIWVLIGLVAILWRMPEVDRRANIMLARGKLVEFLSFLPLFIAVVGASTPQQRIDNLVAIAPVVLIVNQVGVGLSVIISISETIKSTIKAVETAKKAGQKAREFTRKLTRKKPTAGSAAGAGDAAKPVVV